MQDGEFLHPSLFGSTDRGRVGVFSRASVEKAAREEIERLCTLSESELLDLFYSTVVRVQGHYRDRVERSECPYTNDELMVMRRVLTQDGYWMAAGYAANKTRLAHRVSAGISQKKGR